MTNYLNTFKKELGKSPFELTKSNVKKLKRRLPVPNDFNIVWADISSLNGYPSGIVITDKALVYKAPKKMVKSQRKKNIEKAETKDEKRLAKQLRIVYKIIPWEYFDPTEFSLKLVKTAKEEHYELKSEDIIQTTFTEKSLYECFSFLSEEEVRKKQRQEDIRDTSIFNADNTVFFSDTEFNAAYGEGNNKTGFGIYGEEVSTKLDKLSGEDASVVGRDNAKNGPDKIVNGNAVQMKCYKNGTSSVNSCFDNKTKQFRYYDLNGKPMQIEVPSDQYDDAVKQLKKKISEGKVPGVTDPNEAESIIRKSKLNTKQIHNLAKAGTFESISYDAVTGAVQCVAVCGLSALVSFGFSYWQTKDFDKSVKAGLQTGIDVFGPAFASKMLVSQLSRTSLPGIISKGTNEFTKALSPKVRQAIINALRALAGKGPIYGAAAQKSLAKALSSNILVEGVTFLVYLGINTKKLIFKEVTGAQWVKTMTSLSASIVGSAGGALAAGAILSKTSEEFAKSAKGKAVGATVGMAVGTGAGFATSKVGNLIREDDAIITTRLFQAGFINMCYDYLLNENELKDLNSLLDTKEHKKRLKKFQLKLLKTEDQYHAIEEFLTPLFEEIVSKREKIDIETEEKFIEEMSNTIVKLSDDLPKGA